MAQQLTKLKIDEVSLVDEPASPGAKVLIAKRKSPDVLTKVRSWLGLNATEALAKKFDASFKGEETEGNEIPEDEIEGEDANMTETKKGCAPGGMKKGEGDMTEAELAAKKEQEMKDAEVNKALIEKAVADKVAAAVAEITKSKDEEIAKAREESTKLADRVAKMEEAAADSERLAKAKDLLGHGVPGFTVEGVAKTLKALPADQAAEFEKSVRAAAEAVKSSRLFSEVGSRVGKGASSAETELNAKAAELRKSDSKLTEAQAFAKATRDNPDIYKRYRAEQSRSN